MISKERPVVGTYRTASEKSRAEGRPGGGNDDSGGSTVMQRQLDDTHDSRCWQDVMHAHMTRLPTTRDRTPRRVPRQCSRPPTSLDPRTR